MFGLVTHTKRRIDYVINLSLQNPKLFVIRSFGWVYPIKNLFTGKGYTHDPFCMLRTTRTQLTRKKTKRNNIMNHSLWTSVFYQYPSDGNPVLVATTKLNGRYQYLVASYHQSKKLKGWYVKHNNHYLPMAMWNRVVTHWIPIPPVTQ